MRVYALNSAGRSAFVARMQHDDAAPHLETILSILSIAV